LLFCLSAWVGSLAASLSHTMCPFASQLIHRFGDRFTTIAGALVAALALFSSSFVNSIALLYFTHGFVFSIGVALTLTVNYAIIPKYFKKWLGLATGIMISGNGFAFLIMSPLIETLLSHLGWRYTYKTLGGMALIVCGCGLFFSPHVEIDTETERRTTVTQDREGTNRTSLLKNRVFIICCVYGTFLYLGSGIPNLHLVGMAPCRVDCAIRARCN